MSPTTPSIDIRTVRDYLDWRYAITGGHESEDFHRQLVAENRPSPSLYEARAAMARLDGLALALEMR